MRMYLHGSLSYDGDVSAFDRAVEAVRSGETAEVQAKLLYDQLSEEERLGILDGDVPFWQGVLSMGTEGYNRSPYIHGAVGRLGIPGTRFVDGPRGCVSGAGTAFPVSMARGATWDPDLEEQVGEVSGWLDLLGLTSPRALPSPSQSPCR